MSSRQEGNYAVRVGSFGVVGESVHGSCDFEGGGYSRDILDVTVVYCTSPRSI